MKSIEEILKDRDFAECPDGWHQDPLDKTWLLISKGKLILGGYGKTELEIEQKRY